MEDSVAMAANTLPLTSPPGQEVIQKSVTTLQHQSAVLKDRTGQAKDQLGEVLQKWDDHDERCKKLSDWMKEAGGILEDLEEPSTGMNERQKKFNMLQVR